jgi:hypothetical protein
MNRGKLAAVTTFEPRILTAPFEFIVPQLSNLLVATEQAALAWSFWLVWIHDPGDDESDENKAKDLRAELFILNDCANALVSSEGASAAESLKQLMASRQDCKSSRSPPSHLHGCCDSVLGATIAWTEAVSHPQKYPGWRQAAKNLLYTYLPWVLIVSVTMSLKRMLTVITLLPIRPKNWNWSDTLWSLKFTLGNVAIFIASIYSDRFSNFAIPTNQGSGVRLPFRQPWNAL